MKKQFFTLLTLLCTIVGGATSAWAADEISCSAYLSGTLGSPTTTDCALAYYGQDGDPASSVGAGTQVGSTSYYAAKMNNDKNYYEITLNKTIGSNTYTEFKAGDVITVYLQKQSNTQAYKVGKTAQTAVSASNSSNSSEVASVTHTLTAAEIESDGKLRIYRNSSNTYFAGISVSGTRATETYTVTFNAGSYGTCGTASLTETSPGAGVTLPAVTPNSGYAFTGWYTAASEGTKVGDAGDKYSPTSNITIYAQYLAQTAPTISIDEYNPSTIRGVSITFTATANGAPTPTVTWYSNTTASNSGGVDTGETGLTFNPDVSTEGTYYYYAIANNGVDPEAVSNLITLTVSNPDIDRSGYNSYYLANNEDVVSGKRILCDNVTMEYGTATYNKGSNDNMINTLNPNYVASVGSSTNNWGVTFTPTADGILSVGLVANSNKTISVTNVSSFDYEDKDGNTGTSSGTTYTPTSKFYGIVTFNVVSGTTYTVSVTGGSKMSLYGFEFNLPTVTINPAKEYTTYITPAALDFTGLELKAYVATTASSSAVTMVPVTTVPAYTPLVLKKASAASYDVPVITSASAPVSNLLKASDGVSSIGGDGVYDYILSNGLFYHASAGVLPADKCYLHLDSAPSGAHELSLSFEDETTAIHGIELATPHSQGENGELRIENSYYDLQGRKVAQPTKGLYIINGKKVIVK